MELTYELVKHLIQNRKRIQINVLVITYSGSDSSRERKFQGAKFLGKFQGAKVPGSESSWERKFLELSLPGAKVLRSESSCYRLPYLQTYQVSRISRETPAFWSHLPLTRRVIKISRISSTECGQLILSKIVKTVVTRCRILRLKFTIFHFDCGTAPDPAGRAHSHSAPPDSWLDLRDPASRHGVLRGGEGRAGQGEKGERRGKREGRGLGKEKREGKRNIGVGAQSTLRGGTFLPENICMEM